MVANTGTYLDTPFHRFPDGSDLAALATGGGRRSSGHRRRRHRARHRPRRRSTASTSAVPPSCSAPAGSRHWRTPEYGAGGHPHLTAAAVDRLVALGPSLVGIDSVNIDGTADGERPAHTGLLGAGIYVLEHLTALDQLDTPGFEVFAVPAKVRGLGTFPVRAFAALAELSPRNGLP